jgi:hypothetical protein
VEKFDKTRDIDDEFIDAIGRYNCVSLWFLHKKLEIQQVTFLYIIVLNTAKFGIKLIIQGIKKKSFKNFGLTELEKAHVLGQTIRHQEKVIIFRKALIKIEKIRFFF